MVVVENFQVHGVAASREDLQLRPRDASLERSST